MFLYNNVLEGIPFTVTEMTNLTVLDVSNNLLRTFPATLCNLVNLTQLYLRNNEIGSDDFPKDLRGLSGLRDINLSGNRLRHLPQSLFHLEGIVTTLYFFYCKVNYLFNSYFFSRIKKSFPWWKSTSGNLS